ncbi:MAG: hypothetical protein ACJ78Y_10675 [Myxococcales bacterium]
MKSSISLQVALGCLVAAGCRGRPTYDKDVGPILARSCVRCHRAGGVARFPLLETGSQAVAAAKEIRLAVERRDMPPWLADNSGACRTFRDALWLDNRDLKKIIKWTDAPDPGSSNARLHPVAEPRFGPAGAVVDQGVDWQPGVGPNADRCFVADPHLVRETRVTAFRVVSTDARSVAQITLYALDTPQIEAEAEARDRAEEGPGYSCYGSSRVAGARLVTSWTWDSDVQRIPEGFGIRLGAARKVVMQVHYDVLASGLDTPTRTRVELELDPAVHEALFIDVSAPRLSLAPGLKRVEVTTEAQTRSDVTVLGIAPRMRLLGQAMQVDVARGGDRKCAARFDHWDVNRQRLFLYETPLEVQASDVVHLSCVYTTERRTAAVGAGEHIDDEQCLASLLVAGLGR